LNSNTTNITVMYQTR